MGVLIVGTGSYGIYFWQMVTSTVASIQEEDFDREKSEMRQEEVNLTDGDPISVLLMGLDERINRLDLARSDTLILLTINPHLESVHMVSIPRDSYTEIRGNRTKDKISHAHSIGGMETSIRTVENFLDVPVDYFIRVNMDSFKDVVDAVGGVEVENHLDFTFYDVHYPKGVIHLDGEKALGYSRMRHLDPKGDFGRQLRQRQVIEAVMEKGSNLSSITHFDDLFKVIENNVKTNLTLDEMWTIQSGYKKAIEQIEQHQIEGEETKKNGVYYYLPDEEHLQFLSNKLNEHLEVNR
ncbi:LCP family glycopolymer transferase [Halalkalibacter alkalisediminis]|uniref:LCP family protein n=1 Tax=Halalkalibacter alkalisediminis TaxID=935616 RepID=A0ABV6NKT3_9BACI|nr:LCP family protein [Halalkalibacter alkalisediminis]